MVVEGRAFLLIMCGEQQEVRFSWVRARRGKTIGNKATRVKGTGQIMFHLTAH
jgi:hypothetical protein